MQRPLMVAILAALLLTPAATAHARYDLDGGKVHLVVGHLNEPITTYAKTGLDLSLTDAAGKPILDAQNALQAELLAPDNSTTLAAQLQGQFGKPGSYSFNRPYVLTEPGQYRVHLFGSINGTAVDGVYNVAGAVPAIEDATFPARPPTVAALDAAQDAQAQRIADLEARIAALEGQGQPTKDAPAGGALLLLAALAVALAALRMRRSGV